MLRIALSCTALLALLIPSAASAQPTVAKFTATFEAERVVEWDQPRGVSLIDCNGEHFLEAHGKDTWSLRTTKPQKVLVQAGFGGGLALWRFGTWSPMAASTQIGLEAKGPHTRSYSESEGTTGGWCRPGHNVDPQPETDCGTRLTEQLVRLSTIGGSLVWTRTDAPWTRREKLGFDSCTLVPPDGISESDFPVVPRKLAPRALFNRRKGKIVVRGSKTFGPTSTPVPNFGVQRTSTATVSWKLTLVRKK